MPSRRTVLRTLVGGLAVGAGCSSQPDTPPSTSPNPTSATTTPAPTTRATTAATTDEPTTETTTEERARDCASTWEPAPRWSFERPLLRDPVVAAGRVFVTTDGRLFSLSAADGTVQWQQSVGGTVHAVAEGAVLVDDHGRLTALELATGQPRWTVTPPTDHATWSRTLQVHDGAVYVGAAQVETVETAYETEYGRLYRIDVASGERTLLTEVPADDGQVVVLDYVLADETGLYVTLEDGGLVGLDHDGTERWRRRGESWYDRPLRTGALVVQPWSRGVVAIDAATGDTAWRHDGPEMHVAAADGTVYGAGGGSPDAPGTLWALDAATGTPRWRTTIQGCGKRLSAASGTVAAHVGCRPSGHVELLDAARGCHYGVLEQGSTGPPGLAIADHTLYASLQGGSGDRLVAVPLP